MQQKVLEVFTIRKHTSHLTNTLFFAHHAFINEVCYWEVISNSCQI